MNNSILNLFYSSNSSEESISMSLSPSYRTILHVRTDPPGISQQVISFTEVKNKQQQQLGCQ